MGLCNLLVTTSENSDQIRRMATVWKLVYQFLCTFPIQSLLNGHQLEDKKLISRCSWIIASCQLAHTSWLSGNPSPKK